MLSLRRLPACEWRGKERNATPAPGESEGGGGRREERGGALLLQYLKELIEGAPGPTHVVTGARVGAILYSLLSHLELLFDYIMFYLIYQFNVMCNINLLFDFFFSGNNQFNGSLLPSRRLHRRSIHLPGV